MDKKIHWSRFVAFGLALFAGAGCSVHTPMPVLRPEVPEAVPPATFEATNVGRWLDPARERFQLGSVIVDRRTRSIQFPASFNIDSVPLEYLVVAENGKVHESLLVTRAEPTHIHLGLLLLGISDPAPNPAGVSISVQWKRGWTHRDRPAEDLILDRSRQSTLSRGRWIYRGSRFGEGTFAAQRDGSIVALISDPEALADNSRPGHDDDENWLANRSLLPPMGTEATVVMWVGDRPVKASPRRPARRHGPQR